jgi:hypothetical protein
MLLTGLPPRRARFSVVAAAGGGGFGGSSVQLHYYIRPLFLCVCFFVFGILTFSLFCSTCYLRDFSLSVD